MTDLFQELEGLKGGEKQAWVNNNLDLIAALNDSLGFQETARVLRMKPETLAKALAKAEGRHKPSITKAEKAMNQLKIAQSELYETQRQLNQLLDDYENHAEDDRQLREHLQQYFELQVAANTMMSRLVASVGQARTLRNIYSANQSIGNKRFT